MCDQYKKLNVCTPFVVWHLARTMGVLFSKTQFFIMFAKAWTCTISVEAVRGLDDQSSERTSSPPCWLFSFSCLIRKGKSFQIAKTEGRTDSLSFLMELSQVSERSKWNCESIQRQRDKSKLCLPISNFSVMMKTDSDDVYGSIKRSVTRADSKPSSKHLYSKADFF